MFLSKRTVTLTLKFVSRMKLVIGLWHSEDVSAAHVPNVACFNDLQ